MQLERGVCVLHTLFVVVGVSWLVAVSADFGAGGPFTGLSDSV